VSSGLSKLSSNRSSFLLLTESLANKTILDMITWKNGYFHSRGGLVEKIDPYTKKIQIQDELDSPLSRLIFSISPI
jgi:hypothetical protein